MKDELREKIQNMAMEWEPAGVIADAILSLLAPTIEKAEKWDRLTAIAADKGCKGCPVTELCGEHFRYCVVVYILLSAEKTLEGCQDGKTNL
jgi:hypothetical protein